MPSITIKPGRVQPVWAGHPWVYAQAVQQRDGTFTPGCEVDVLDAKGKLLGRGLWSPDSAIAVRLFTRRDRAIDRAFFRERLEAALQRRRQWGLPSGETSAFRWVHGEGDGLPGLILDVFGSSVSTQFGTVGLWQRRAELVELINETLAPRRVLDRTPARLAKLEGFDIPNAARGGDMEPLEFVELGIRYRIPDELQHKTGYYCDQRPLREWLKHRAHGLRVLDLFSFVGALGLNAARGGASAVHCVERNERAVEVGRATAEANGCATVTMQQQDVMQHLEHVPSNSYDMTLCDPPKLALNKRTADAASRRLRRLAREAIRVTALGGDVVLSSCSASVGPAELSRALALGALDAGRQVTITHRFFQGPDHPVVAGFSEGEYLSTLVGQVSERL